MSKDKCPKCRTSDYISCNSIKCPMRQDIQLIHSDWSIEECFNKLRHDNNFHIGLGDIRLTIGMQEEICELINKYYKKKSKHITKSN